MKIGILDDEREVAATLRGYAERFAAENNVQLSAETFLRAADLLAAYGDGYDVLFLDIDMPGINGLEAARRIRSQDKNVVIVFVTNMAQYAINGYEVHAVDFVLKPLSYYNFALKMNKALGYVRVKTTIDRSLPLHAQDGLINVKISAIDYVEVRKNYLYYYADGKEYKVRGTMKNAEAELAGYEFYRISNCYLVNMRKIAKVGSTGVTVGGTELPISRHKKDDFMKTFIKFSSRTIWA